MNTPDDLDKISTDRIALWMTGQNCNGKGNTKSLYFSCLSLCCGVMRYLALILLLTGLCCGQSATSTGNNLLSDCGDLIRDADSGFSPNTVSHNRADGWCIGYISGFFDGMAAEEMLISPDNESYKTLHHAYICVPDDVTMGQQARVVVKWLNDHPERLHELAMVLLVAAFHDKFPCPSETPSKPKTDGAK